MSCVLSGRSCEAKPEAAGEEGKGTQALPLATPGKEGTKAEGEGEGQALAA